MASNLIKSMSSGRYIQVSVSGGSSSYIQPSGGQLRYNTTANDLEVFDGVNWTTITGNAYLQLTYDAESALDWVREKIKEERELKELADIHPAVKAALETVVKAQEQLKLITILSKEEK